MKRDKFGMAMDQARVDDWLDRYESLMQIRPADEATASYHRQQINLLGREVGGIALADAPELLPARANLARRERNFDRAIEIWQEHARLNPDDSENATLNIADIQLLQNDIAAARATLVTITGCDRPLYHKIQGKLAEMERLLLASTRYNEALKQFGQGQREAFCGSVLSALDLLHGATISQHPQVVALVKDLSFGCTTEPPEDTTEIPLPETGDGPDPVAIFASGFGWSGSGAVFDFLRQHKDAEPFSAQEIGIFGSGEGDALKCLDALRSEPKAFVRTFAGTICHGVLGLSGRGDRGIPFIRKAISRSLLQIFCENDKMPDDILLLTRRLVKKIILEAPGDEMKEGVFTAAFSEYFQYILRLKSSEKKYLLFSNAISGPYIGALQLLPDSSKGVASVRDVRDAYADRFISGKRWTAETFIRSYRSKIRNFERGIHFAGVKKKVVKVQFEDFILSDSYRQEILKSLDMDVTGWLDSRIFFDASRSEKNINVHRFFENRDAIEKIEHELSDYTWVPSLENEQKA